jgi:hypothetical protein
VQGKCAKSCLLAGEDCSDSTQCCSTSYCNRYVRLSSVALAWFRLIFRYRKYAAPWVRDLFWIDAFWCDAEVGAELPLQCVLVTELTSVGYNTGKVIINDHEFFNPFPGAGSQTSCTCSRGVQLLGSWSSDSRRWSVALLCLELEVTRGCFDFDAPVDDVGDG